ncbi:MAG: S8 family serine peptidase [Flammeovirgaceae bacterium]
MKKFNLLFMLALAALLYSCSNVEEQELVELSDEPSKEQEIPGKYIVVFQDDYIASGRMSEPIFTDRAAKIAYTARKSGESLAKMESFLSTNKIGAEKVSHRYTSAIAGFAAELTDKEVERLKADPNVLSVEPDREVFMQEFWVESVETAEEAAAKNVVARQTPCAVSNAGGVGNGSGSNTWVWVVDSGIDLDHPDLNVVTNTSYARSFVGGSANDCNGHGTHVAGIAGAISNSIGISGVSAGVPVVPIRVFGCSGGSSSSTIIAGIDHVAANDISGDVMNLSLGGFYGSGCSSGSAYRSAVNRVANGGTHVAIAAGNSSANANLYQPACLNGSRIYTVASMTCGQSFSSFSNFGVGPIDWIATGSSVYSTYLNGGYATLSGTSMASPVVAGILHQRNGAPRQCGTVTRSGVTYRVACR